jgi:hypothetical protein
MAIEEGCLLLWIVEGIQWYARGFGKRLRVMRVQEEAGMTISLIARYKNNVNPY